MAARLSSAVLLSVLLFDLAGRGMPAEARSLSRRVEDLLAPLPTRIQAETERGDFTPSIPVPRGLRAPEIGSALSAARSQAPIPSASGSFRYAWDTESFSFHRLSQGLGPTIAERAQTIGRHNVLISAAYSQIEFDTLEGQSLDGLQAQRSVLSSLPREELEALPPPSCESMRPPPKNCRLRIAADDDLFRARVNLGLSLDMLFFTGAFGVTDSIDVSIALSVNRIEIDERRTVEVEDRKGNSGTFLIVDPDNPQGPVVRSLTGGFDESAFGTGDLFLRAKWNFFNGEWVDLATAGILTLPTGNADDFLGFHEPTFTPSLIASETFGRVSPHVNLGYSFRDGDDVSQALWIVGTEVMTWEWLTLGADFLGYHDDRRDGLNDDVVQSAVGFKVNPIGDAVISATFQFPVNRDGLRADVIYTGQVEYTF